MALFTPALQKQLPFETATVDYTVSGAMTGEKTIYVKDFGRTTAEYSSVTMKMMGMTQNQEEIIITTPDWVFSADLVEGRAPGQGEDLLENDAGQTAQKEAEEVTDDEVRQGVQNVLKGLFK